MSPAGLARLLTANEPLASDRFLVPRHIGHISRMIARAVAGHGPDRIMVSAPPRHGKSVLVSWYTPLWFLERWPEKSVMLGTYSADFAAEWGRKVRNTAVRYADRLDLRLSEDSQAAGRWNTTAGGGMMAQGVGGGFTGKPGHLLICDDPIKNSDEANSAVYRSRVWDWWRSTYMSRLEPGAVVVLTMTRWHVDDLMGRILADPEQAKFWQVVSLPAIAESTDEIGRNVGDPLWPERYTAEELHRRHVEVGDYVWKALYQQKPPNLDGGNVYYAFRYADFPAGNVDASVQIAEGVPLDLSIDFNKRPGSHAVIGQYHRDADAATAIAQLFTPNGVAKHIAQAFVQWWNTHKPEVPRVHLYGDASGGSGVMTDGQSAWQTVHRELSHADIPFRSWVPNRNPGVHDRVESVNNALCDAEGKRRYRIHPSCTKLIIDLQKVAWDKDDIDKTSNVELSHMSDADGYRISQIMSVRGSHRQMSATVGFST